MIKAFPKIFAIGTDYIKDIFDDEVEITEKIDGSQFDFGKINNQLYMRSKGTQQFIENPDKMFKEAVDYVVSIESIIPDNKIFYCEYLRTPKHNVLKYNRIPKNHLALFGISDHTHSVFHSEKISEYATYLDIESIPVLMKCKINNHIEFTDLLNNESALGGTKIEGVVIKNYSKKFLLGGQPIPIMAGKFVSENFKEVSQTIWKGEHTSKGKWETFKESFRTEARWRKAIQHLNDEGRLLNEPKDIGLLIKEIQRDITEEEIENIKSFLWKEFGQEVLRKATSGFPEWYKEELMKRSFENKVD